MRGIPTQVEDSRQRHEVRAEETHPATHWDLRAE
jgi:hypothetical protein